MKHHGNVTKINGAEVEPVDIVSFGSPCQDLSVAGKRAGIQDGERSNLFFEAVRIIKEMREATNGEYPKYAVWENVPGAFSSNKGHDFHAVLEALCSVCDDTVSIPKPYDTKRTKLEWNKAGEIVGDNYSIAWRTLDAQYWGAPQRRKRIYLVADFTGGCAGEILFKPESLRGDFTQGDEAGKGASADAVGGVDGSVGVECLILKERAGCEGGGKGALWSDKAFTLATNQDMSVIAFAQNQRDEVRDLGDKAGALAAEAGGHQQTYIAQPVIALQGNVIDRADTARCNGCGWRENESYTLTTIDRHAVAFQLSGDRSNPSVSVSEDKSYCVPANPMSDRGQAVCYVVDQGGGKSACNITEENAPTLTCTHGGEPAVCFENHQHGGYREGCGTLRASGGDYGGGSENVIVAKTKPPRKYIIRRLLPVECARLQGFPDKWGWLAPYDPADAEFWEQVRKTHAEINGKKYKPVKNLKAWYDKLHTDSAEYRMWGNGIALPNARYVIQGIAEHGAKTLGSLFDGSGGFPLAGAMNGITPLWASEVEPYCIAATKSRFKEAHNGK